MYSPTENVADSNISQENEHAPLLNSQNNQNYTYGNNRAGSKDESSSGINGVGAIPPEDRQKREQDLADVVHSTSDNLIDISAVEQPEVLLRDTSGRRTASEFKQAFLQETTEPFGDSEASTSPSSMIRAVIPLINKIQPKSMSEETKQWLDTVSKEAVAALESEPVVNLVGDLVLTFE